MENLGTQFIILIIGLSTFIISIFFYVIVLLRLLKLRRDEKKAEARKNKMLMDAKSKSDEAINDAIAKSNSILQKTEYLRDELLKQAKDSLKSVGETSAETLKDRAHRISKYYDELALHLNKNFMQKQTDALISLEKFETQEMNQVDEMIRRKTEFSEKRMTQYEADEKAKMLKQVEDYRVKEIKKIDESASRIVLQVAKEMLKESITISSHEKLIIEALEKAKKDNVI